MNGHTMTLTLPVSIWRNMIRKWSRKASKCSTSLTNMATLIQKISSTARKASRISNKGTLKEYKPQPQKSNHQHLMRRKHTCNTMSTNLKSNLFEKSEYLIRVKTKDWERPILKKTSKWVPRSLNLFKKQKDRHWIRRGRQFLRFRMKTEAQKQPSWELV